MRSLAFCTFAIAALSACGPPEPTYAIANPWDLSTLPKVKPYTPIKKGPGCPIEMVPTYPADITEKERFWFFTKIGVTCPKEEPEAVCLRRLQDQACALGAGFLYMISELYPEDDHTRRWEATPAVRR